MALYVLAFVLLAWGAVQARRARLQRRAFTFLERFERLPELGAYREGLPASSYGGLRVPHAVLLVHGYSASPAAFKALTAHLDRRGIPYLAPALTGFGLDGFRLLERATAADWRRDVNMAYEQLAGLADEVSVVAISFGTLLAAELATRRPVRELVLVAPYFYLKGQTEQKLAALLARPWARALALALSPYLAKPMREGRSQPVDIADPAHAARFFQYPSLPLRSLIEVWTFPRLQDFRALRCRRLAVCFGGAELTSDVPRLLAVLAEQGVAAEVRSYPRSAHNLFDDYDAEQAAADVADLLA